MPETIAVILTSHNRKTITLACLGRLFAQELPANYALAAYLVDDKSTDGTADAVRATHPSVHVIPGDGSLYWCNGMRLAWTHASDIEPEYYLWLNDDTLLTPGALKTLVGIAEAAETGCIVIGSCRDPQSGVHTYGGLTVRGRHPGRTELMKPDPTRPKLVDTFNGNCVLVTKDAFQTLGLVRSFRHAIGDIDYGLTAKACGIPNILAPEFIAECPANPLMGTWQNRRCSRMQRMRTLLGRKGLPPLDWWRFLWRHAGAMAFVYWPAPYIRVVLGTGGSTRGSAAVEGQGALQGDRA